MAKLETHGKRTNAKLGPHTHSKRKNQAMRHSEKRRACRGEISRA